MWPLVLEELEQVVRQHGVDHVEVLAQAVEDLRRGHHVEVGVDRCAQDAGQHPLVHVARGAPREGHEDGRAQEGEGQAGGRELGVEEDPGHVAALGQAVRPERLAGPLRQEEVGVDAEGLRPDDQQQREREVGGAEAAGAVAEVEAVGAEGQDAHPPVLGDQQAPARVDRLAVAGGRRAAPGGAGLLGFSLQGGAVGGGCSGWG